MNKTHGPWTIKSSQEIYRNEFIRVTEDAVIQPDRAEGRYATVAMKEGVLVLALDDDENVYLTKQFRYALGAESLEAIAGSCDEGSPEDNARREAKEELGLEADEWIALAPAETDTSIVRSRAHFFIARGLRFGEPEREGTEAMRPVKLKFREAVDKVLAGEIVHALSCVLILKADYWLKREAGAG